MCCTIVGLRVQGAAPKVAAKKGNRGEPKCSWNMLISCSLTATSKSVGISGKPVNSFVNDIFVGFDPKLSFPNVYLIDRVHNQVFAAHENVSISSVPPHAGEA